MHKDEPRLRVFLIGDDDTHRFDLRRSLGSASDVDIIGESASFERASDLVQESRPDVIVANVCQDGSQAEIQALRSAFPGIHVVAVSSSTDTHFAERVLRAGALGFVNYRTALAEITEAVRSVFRGKAYVSRRVARKILRQLMQPDEDPLSRLTDREREIFGLVGYQDIHQIADVLGLSTSTIRGYCRRIRIKLDLASVAELVSYARQVHSEQT